MKVRVAVAPDAPFDVGQLVTFVRELEARRFDGLWLSDIPLGDSAEPLVVLAYAAAMTTKLKLGANVVPFGRSPVRLAKDLAQIDQLSGGRLLLSLVPGVGEPAERRALDAAGDRGVAMELIMDQLRGWWAGEAVAPAGAGTGPGAPPVKVRPTPVQEPLELWLGGRGPKALERVGRMADGWLGAFVTPTEAGDARRTIEQAAGDAGRKVDPEHFGLSIGYGRDELPAATVASLAARRPGATLDHRDLVPVGAAHLTDLLGRHAEQGISKFVVRPLARRSPWDEELAWLADVVLPLQT